MEVETPPVPCIVCGVQLEAAGPHNQPHEGTSFQAYGQYGSTAFDPMDGTFIEINVCDKCLLDKKDRVVQGQKDRRVLLEGAFVGWEECQSRLEPWDPDAGRGTSDIHITLEEAAALTVRGRSPIRIHEGGYAYIKDRLRERDAQG